MCGAAQIGLSLACALLIPAAAFAQAAFSPSISPIALSNQPVQEIVTTTGGPISNFNATIIYAQGDPEWLCLSQGGTSSPVQLTGLSAGSSDAAVFDLSVGNCGVNLPGTVFNAQHGQYTATVTLHDTVSADNVADDPITVTYTVGSGSGGGNGSLTASPPSVTSTAYSGTFTTAVQVSTTSTSFVPLSFSTSSTANWLSFTETSNSINNQSPTTLTLTMNGTGNQPQTFSTNLIITTTSAGTLTIPITYYYGVAASGGGNGGNSGSISSPITSLPWAYSSSNPSAYPTPTTVTPTSTNGSVGFTVTASSSNGWLLVNNQYTVSGTAGVTPLTISASSGITTLSPGTYGGIITITEQDNQATATILVTATITGSNPSQITISPNPISVAASVGGATGSTSVTITSTVTGTLSLTASGSGISVSATGTSVTAGVPITVTVFGNPSGLSNNTYIGSLTAGIAGSTLNAEITFAVGTIGANPNTLQWTYSSSNPSLYPIPATVTPASTNGSVGFTATASSSNGWLLVNNQYAAAGTAGETALTISAGSGIATLASGTYAGIVTITEPDDNATPTFAPKRHFRLFSPSNQR